MTSADDWTKELIFKGFPQIREIFKLYGPADNVMAWYRSFPHNYNQVSRELMYNWMNKYLKLGFAEPVTEQPFVPIPPTELSVYDADHPRPADSADAMALRKTMTMDAEKQLAGLEKNRDEYRKVVTGALSAMIVDALPAAGDIVVGDSRGPIAFEGEAAIEKGTLRRKAGVVRVPFVAVKPALLGWDACSMGASRRQGEFIRPRRATVGESAMAAGR